jgi:hypothetical protein
MPEKPEHVSQEDWDDQQVAIKAIRNCCDGIQTRDDCERALLKSNDRQNFIDLWRDWIEKVELKPARDAVLDDFEKDERKALMDRVRRLRADLAWLNEHYPA